MLERRSVSRIGQGEKRRGNMGILLYNLKQNFDLDEKIKKKVTKEKQKEFERLRARKELFTKAEAFLKNQDKQFDKIIQKKNQKEQEIPLKEMMKPKAEYIKSMMES